VPPALRFPIYDAGAVGLLRGRVQQSRRRAGDACGDRTALLAEPVLAPASAGAGGIVGCFRSERAPFSSHAQVRAAAVYRPTRRRVLFFVLVLATPGRVWRRDLLLGHHGAGSEIS